MFSLLPALLLLAGPQGDLETQMKRFIDVFALVEEHAADPVSLDQAFYQGALPGLLRRLDPHSVFFDPGNFEQLKQLQTSTQKGFGTVVSVLPGRVIVLQTLPGTPSERSGISPGDEIVGINNIPLAALDMDQLIALLSQSRQQQVQLYVRRPGNARLLEFVLTPEEMQSPSVERAFLLEPGFAYIRVTSFDANTPEELRGAIENLGGASLKGLVLDLRNNTGGVMGAALETASFFLKPGQKIVSVRGRKVETQDIDVPAGPAAYEFPLAVLINEKSASGSEIVAGALQDHDRAVILGEPSFGKGLVQSVYPLSEGTGVALTTAFYYTPSGRSIQRPLAVGQLGEALGAAARAPAEYRTDSGRLVTGGGGIEPDITVFPDATTRLRMVLDVSGAFAHFATEVLRRQDLHVTAAFEVTPRLLDQFQAFLSRNNIRPGLAEWSRDLAWTRSRLHQEIFNQALGVEKGDEIEARRDPVVRRAVDELERRP
ncbi:MAG: S41 family peptidase [Bryobacteraceae bacterium]